MDFKPEHLAVEENNFVQNGNYPCSGFVKFVTAHPYITVAVLCLMCTILTTSTSFGSMYTILALIPMLVILFAGVPTGIYFSAKYAKSSDERKKMAMFSSLAIFVCAVVFFLAITMNGNMAIHIMNYALCKLSHRESEILKRLCENRQQNKRSPCTAPPDVIG